MNLLTRSFLRSTRFTGRNSPIIRLRSNVATEDFTPNLKQPKPQPKAKPNKSPNALKRTASASLPIRSNPTPTRGKIQPVFTFSTAERYQLPLLEPLLPQGSLMFENAWWIPKWTPSNKGATQPGEVWVFADGCYVCWGLEEGDARRVGKEVIRAARGAEIGPLLQEETEELEFVTDPTECA
jgi:uncharacterized Rmd1/YagE family protein